MMRFTGLATACTASVMVGCSVPLVDDVTADRVRQPVQTRAAMRHAAAARHSQLSLAYLAANRLDVARGEALKALALAPNDMDALHASALVEVASGRRDTALRYFAAAVDALDGGSDGVSAAVQSAATSSVTLSFSAATLLSNYALALCDEGKVADAERVYQRAVDLDVRREGGEALVQPCFVDGDAS